MVYGWDGGIQLEGVICKWVQRKGKRKLRESERERDLDSNH